MDADNSAPSRIGNLPTDIQQHAEDRVREYIERKFKGHGLARLVDGVLGELARPLCSSEVEHRVFWRTTKSSPLTFRRNFL